MRTAEHENGYSLIEVIVATAILAMVLLSVMTLFFLGRRNVYSGRQQSRANAVAVRALEDFSYLTASEVLGQLGLDDNSPAAGGACGCVTIKNTDSTAPAFVNNWDSYVAQSQMAKGVVAVSVTPVGGTLLTANFLRIGVTVSWVEEARSRSVTVTTAKAMR